jgi:hypothetical protein
MCADSEGVVAQPHDDDHPSDKRVTAAGREGGLFTIEIAEEDRPSCFFPHENACISTRSFSGVGPPGLHNKIQFECLLTQQSRLSHPEPKSGMRLLCSGNLVPESTKHNTESCTNNDHGQS